MKRKVLTILLPAAAILAWLIAGGVSKLAENTTHHSATSILSEEGDRAGPFPAEDRPTGGPDWQRRFFARWHEPYGAELDPEVEAEIREEIERLPSEVPGRDVNSWELVGPSGMARPSGSLYSGRVLDLDALTGTQLVVAAASGGLWRYQVVFPIPLTDDVTSQWIGTVAIDPNDEDIMLIGTGEFSIRSGTGLWKTTDGGQTWQHKPMSPEPSSFFRIRYGSDGLTVHAATRNGYYRSTDRGETWLRIQFDFTVTDLAVVPGNPDVLYITPWGEGLYVSYDAGLHWIHVVNPVIPTSDVTRGAVSVCASNPAVIYAAFARLDRDAHVMKGIYKSTNSGYSWDDVSPASNYFGRQGWYNNVIAVSPTDPNLVLAGGVSLLKTVNGGVSWVPVDDDHVHVDHHALQWHPNGIYVWDGNDGGWTFSNNKGTNGSWTSSANTLPITQYVEIDAQGISWESASICGGSQDNGISTTWDGGDTWEHKIGGDGGGLEFGTGSLWEVFFAVGAKSDGLTFHRYYSDDGCNSYIEIIDGLPPSDTWYPAMRISGSGRVYTNSGGEVFRWSPDDMEWQPENTAPFGTYVTELTVSPTPNNPPILYACLNSTNSWRMYVKDGDWWYERSDQLPPDVKIRKVVPHPANSWRAYALINGLGTPGEKIFWTADRGVSWVNITGNLPNVPLADLIVFPDNDDLLFVGSEYGFYRTSDGGTHWERWNYGVPEAVVVTEMKALDMRQFYQGFHIVAATYGRSIYRRDISGSDPGVSVADRLAIPTVSIRQVTPNPFTEKATIRFDLRKDALVEVRIFDVNGRSVRQLYDGRLTAGAHALTWDRRDENGRRVSSGVYLVRIGAGGQGATRKLQVAG